MLTKKESKVLTLYKKDSKGKIRYLTIEALDDEVIQKSGLQGGAEVVNISKCSGKNLGRSNETLPEEQAVLVAKAKYTKKLKEGYFVAITDALKSVVILPMLAKVFEKEKKKVIYPCYAQPKLDGMRGLGDCDQNTLTSRSGNNIETLGHITDAFPLLTSINGLVLDGELYAHGLSFQENMRIIKKERPETINVKYHVYDCISDKPFAERYELIKNICLNNTMLELVETIEIVDEDQLMKYHSVNIARGYEGTIVRWGEEEYKLNGRSSNLLKLKDFDDLALTLMDVIPSEKRPTHGKPIFFWEGAEDNRIGAGVSLSHAEAEDLLANKAEHIGKVCELRFFEYSDTGVPRHPVMHGFRLDK